MRTLLNLLLSWTPFLLIKMGASQALMDKYYSFIEAYNTEHSQDIAINKQSAQNQWDDLNKHKDNK